MSLKPRDLVEELIFAEEEFHIQVQYSIEIILNKKNISHIELAKLLNISEAEGDQ